MTDEIRFLGDLQRLDTRPGDRFVLTVRGRLHDEAKARIAKLWQDFIGDGEKHLLLILEDGMTLGVIGVDPRVKPEDGEDGAARA